MGTVSQESNLATRKMPGEEPPCQRACPAGIDVPRYVRLIANGRFAEALAVIREKIPFPSVCGWVCFHPCEAECRLNDVDAPVAIRALKRFVAERPWSGAEQTATVKPTGKRVAIVGSGPAGLTAAHYLAKLGGHAVTVFEALPETGGTMRTGIPTYRLPPHVLNAEISEIRKVGVDIKTNHRVDSVDELFQQDYNAVFLAVGARRGIKLGIEGEKQAGIIDAVTFLKEVNLGGKPNVGKRVIVVGGGNAAIDAARTALRLGTPKVTVIYRRSRAEMPASPEEIEEALHEGVDIIYLAAPTRAERTDGTIRMECLRMELGEPDASGRRSPKPIPGSQFTIEADTVIAAIGQMPELPVQMGLAVDKDNALVIKPDTLETSRAGVFAGGDAVTGPASVIEAIAAGRKAAAAIDRYLGGSGAIEELLAPPEGEVTPLKPSLPLGERKVIPSLAIAERLKGFSAVELPLTEEMAIAQAMRCLRCDLPIDIDASHCAGCRTCELRCSLRLEQAFNPGQARIKVRRLVNQPNEFGVFFTDECDACGICARYCPYGSIIRHKEVAR